MAAFRTDPYLAFRYAIEIDHLVVGGFSDAGGLNFETEVETFREGGTNDSEWQLAGAQKSSARLVLKRGLGDAHALWQWFQMVRAGRMKRRDLSVLLIDADGKELMRWRFRNACPVKWSGPELKAKSSEVALETVEFVHQGLAP